MPGVVQLIVAVAIGLAVLGTGRWAIKVLAQPGPEEPDPDQVVEVEAMYRCTVCGLRLTVTHAQGSDIPAPRHCREEMVPA